MRQHAHDVLDLAWLLGIRHFDAARSYGLAEEFLGSWLAEHPGRRGEVTIGSKWGYTYVADWRVDADKHEVKDHSEQTFRRQWEETLRALGSAPDVYLVHSVTPDSPALGDARLLAALREKTSDGVRVGISTSGPHQRDVLARALSLGPSSPLSAVQSTWNLLETDCGEALRQAYDAGWHVALKETVANGRLTTKAEIPPALAAVAARHGTGPDAVAVAAALDQPASVALIGATTAAQLQSNAQAVDVHLDESDLTALRQLAEDPTEYWTGRSALPWN
jgi:aryl-alcohol dehydrogenase-like predicted oxidoreductase